MSIADELERLSKLHKEGLLNDEEFSQAKSKLLSQSSLTLGKNSLSSPDNTLGGAAKLYVTWQIATSIIGFIIFLIILFAVILPHMDSGMNGQIRINPVLINH